MVCKKKILNRPIGTTHIFGLGLTNYALFYRDEYLFNFDNTFEIHDDIEVLKRMGMTFGLEKGQCSQADLSRCLKMVPKALEPYVLGKKFVLQMRILNSTVHSVHNSLFLVHYEETDFTKEL